jgi:hypothetical protein
LQNNAGEAKKNGHNSICQVPSTIVQQVYVFSFFQKEEAALSGRGGLIFRYNNTDYSIDSEMSFNKSTDIVVYKDSVQLKKRTTVLVRLERKKCRTTCLTI